MSLFDRLLSTPLQSTSTPPAVLADWPVVYKRLRQAKNLTLRVNAAKKQIVVSYPWRASKREADRFVASHQEWLLEQVGQANPAYRLAIGEMIPVQGVMRHIVHMPTGARGVGITITETDIQVTGNPDRVPRAVYRYLKNLAEREITRLVSEKAGLLGKPVRKITFRDTHSRWGSCTSDGELNFCWRLILAPPEVLDYVVAHEVAHLVHMHHQPSFWALCRKLTVYTTAGKNWLKAHGQSLQVMF